jgi:hypothetical protein
MSEYISGFEVVRSKRKTFSIEVTCEAKVILKAPLKMKREDIERIVESKKGWIEKHVEKMKNKPPKKELSDEEMKRLFDSAAEYIPKRVEHFAPIVGVTYNSVKIKNQKTLWGSCSSKGNLNFNCMLMTKDCDLIDYVVVHELCHRKEMNHSEKFWAEVEKIIPDYREKRSRLKR